MCVHVYVCMCAHAGVCKETLHRILAVTSTFFWADTRWIQNVIFDLVEYTFLKHLCINLNFAIRLSTDRWANNIMLQFNDYRKIWTLWLIFHEMFEKKFAVWDSSMTFCVEMSQGKSHPRPRSRLFNMTHSVRTDDRWAQTQTTESGRALQGVPVM